MKMFMVELALLICILMYLMAWTAYDPPSRTVTKTLVGEEGNIVETTIMCSSESDGWTAAVLCWQGVMAMCATVLVALSDQIIEDFKESRALASLIYCQDVFLILRVAVYLSRDAIQPSVHSCTLSFLLSFDALLSSAIYFGPLLFQIVTGDIDDEEAELQCLANYSGRNAGTAAGDADATHASTQARSANESTNENSGAPRVARNDYHHQVGVASATNVDLNALIRNRLREAEDRGAGHITAECSHSLRADDVSN